MRNARHRIRYGEGAVYSSNRRVTRLTGEVVETLDYDSHEPWDWEETPMERVHREECYAHWAKALRERMRNFFLGLHLTTPQREIVDKVVFDARVDPFVYLDRLAFERKVSPEAIAQQVRRIEKRVAHALGDAVQLISFRAYLIRQRSL